MGTSRSGAPRRAARWCKKAAMAAWPWYSYGSGGMVSQASLVSRVSTASMSPASTAAAKRPARWRSRAESGSGVRSLPAAAAVAQRVQAAVDGDLVQPGAQRGPALEVAQAAPGRQQGVLQRVLSVLYRAEDLVGEPKKLGPVGVGELAERLLVARLGAGERACRHHRILASALSFTPS